MAARHSLVHRARCASIALGLAALIVLGVVGVACMQGCTRQQGDLAIKVLSMSAEQCAKFALSQGRKDVALACGLTDSALDVLEQSMKLTVCDLPDAGHD